MLEAPAEPKQVRESVKGHPGSGPQLSSLRKRQAGLLGPLVYTAWDIDRVNLCVSPAPSLGTGARGKASLEQGCGTRLLHRGLATTRPLDQRCSWLTLTEAVCSDCPFGMASPSERGWSEIVLAYLIFTRVCQAN